MGGEGVAFGGIEAEGGASGACGEGVRVGWLQLGGGCAEEAAQEEVVAYVEEEGEESGGSGPADAEGEERGVEVAQARGAHWGGSRIE